MKKDYVILIAEDDPGHAGLINKYLQRAGIMNNKILFKDGAEILDFLFEQRDNLFKENGTSYVLLLDIHLPKVDGVGVLRRVKMDKDLSVIPVIMFTTSNDPETIKTCHELGCLEYYVKSVDHNEFLDAIKNIGSLLRAGSISDSLLQND